MSDVKYKENTEMMYIKTKRLYVFCCTRTVLLCSCCDWIHNLWYISCLLCSILLLWFLLQIFLLFLFTVWIFIFNMNIQFRFICIALYKVQ